MQTQIKNYVVIEFPLHTSQVQLWSHGTEAHAHYVFLLGHLTFLIQVLQLQPENAKALFRSGVAKLNLNRLEGAEEDLKKAETLDPEGNGSAKHSQ